MDVVVSENSAVNSAVGNMTAQDRATRAARIADISISRLTEDLANAISSRVTSLPGMVPTTSASSDQPALQSGILSSLSELFPGGVGGSAVPTAGEATSSLNSVLQSLTAYSSGAQPPNDSSTPVETTSPAMPPTFQFSTPPPAFPIAPARFNPLPVRFDPLPPITESGGSVAPLPDALGPLSPSPDQETQQNSENQDVTMNAEAAAAAPGTATVPGDQINGYLGD